MLCFFSSIHVALSEVKQLLQDAHPDPVRYIESQSKIV